MRVELWKRYLSTELLRALAKIVSLASPQLLLFLLETEPQLRGGVVQSRTEVGVLPGLIHFIVALGVHPLVRRRGVLLAQTRVLRYPDLYQWLHHIEVVLILLLVPDGRPDFIFELVELLRVLLEIPFVPPSVSLCGEVEVLVMETLGESLPWLGGPWGCRLGEIIQLIQFEVSHP